MANKKITELQLRDNVTADLNLPGDDGIQTYRVTALQMKDYVLTDVLSQLVPVASILDCNSTTAPTGFLLCDGSAVSRTTYAGLFAQIGTKFGAGNGSTTFNVPNFSSDTDWSTYTPSNSGGFGTLSTLDLRQRIRDGMWELHGGFRSGTVTGSMAQLELPTGLTIAGTSAKRYVCGYLTRAGSAGPYSVMALQGRTYLSFGGGAGSHGDTPGNSILNNNEDVLITARVPILQITPFKIIKT